MKIQLFPKYTYLYLKRGIIQTVLTKVSISVTIYILKTSTFWHLSNSPQPETLFVLKQCQINQRIKSNRPNNCESTSFENQKQMYGSIQKRINKVNTYHYPTTTTCKRNKS